MVATAVNPDTTVVRIAVLAEAGITDETNSAIVPPKPIRVLAKTVVSAIASFTESEKVDS